MSIDTQRIDTERGAFRVASLGDPQAPAVVFSNSLGTILEMWQPQVAVFAEQYRVVCYDTRGHGGSPVTSGPYNFEMLGQDVLAIMDALEIEQAAFCGISMGGHTGLWLALHAAERFKAVAVCNSAAKIGTQQAWSERAQMLRTGGMQAMELLAETAPERWFTPEFIGQHEAVVKEMQAILAEQPPLGYAACCDALGSSDLRDQIASIRTPTLLLTGDADPVTTVADATAMHQAIEQSELAVIPASHLSNIEAPAEFNRVIKDFFDKQLNNDAA